MSTREELINAIDSPTVAALAQVFDPRHQRMDKSYSEQIVEILAPRLAALAATPAVGGEVLTDKTRCTPCPRRSEAT